MGRAAVTRPASRRWRPRRDPHGRATVGRCRALGRRGPGARTVPGTGHCARAGAGPRAGTRTTPAAGLQRIEVLTSAPPDPTGPASDLWRERRFGAMGSAAHLVVRGGSDALVEWAVEEVAVLAAAVESLHP